MKIIPTFFCTMAILASVVTGSYAQERTAAGAMENQMTWSALSTLVNGVNTKTDAINTRVDQVVLCATKGMVYAPGTAGSDAQGCHESAVPTSVTNSITNLTNLLNTANTNITSISNCGMQGKVYNKNANGCVAEEATVKTLGAVSFSMSTGSNQAGSRGAWGIPAGTSIIVANVMCKVVGSKATIDSTVIFNNSGGYPANKLCYLAGVSKDNTATTMQTLYIPVPQGASTFRVDYSATQVQNTTSLEGTMTFMGH